MRGSAASTAFPAFPTLNVPGDPNWAIFGTAYYYVVIVCLLAAYLIAAGFCRAPSDEC